MEGNDKLSGSIGWRYDFNREESMKNIFRTHTTAVSTKYLKMIGDEY